VAPVVSQLGQPTAAELVDVATVFDRYRRHYGQPVVAGQTLAWLTRYTALTGSSYIGHNRHTATENVSTTRPRTLPQLHRTQSNAG